jgi:SH3 domain-containing YSC84-like protein 1
VRKVTHIVVALISSAGIATVAATKVQSERIRQAAAVLHDIRDAPDKGIAEDLWKKAACVGVVPSVKKAAFIVGGEYGKGVMSCRDGSAWTAPSSIVLEKGSFGLQLGGETVDLAFLVMNDRGVQRLLDDKVALGGEASAAAGPVGRDVRAMTDLQLTAEILSYSRSQGLFAGIDLTGGVLKPDNDDNHDLYGRPVTARDILVAKRVRPPSEAEPFMSALARADRPGSSGR